MKISIHTVKILAALNDKEGKQAYQAFMENENTVSFFTRKGKVFHVKD